MQYHPHQHGSTALQVGTAHGLIVVEDDNEFWMPPGTGCDQVGYYAKWHACHCCVPPLEVAGVFSWVVAPALGRYVLCLRLCEASKLTACMRISECMIQSDHACEEWA
jgi:hypothetical protein